MIIIVYIPETVGTLQDSLIKSNLLPLTALLKQILDSLNNTLLYSFNQLILREMDVFRWTIKDHVAFTINPRNLIIAFIQTTVFNITIMSHSYQDCKRNKGSNDEVQHRNHSKASHLWWECNWERHIKKGIDRMEHSTMDESVLSLYFLVEDDIG